MGPSARPYGGRLWALTEIDVAPTLRAARMPIIKRPTYDSGTRFDATSVR